MPEIKAVLFDMDGVLIDAKDWHYEALNKALNHFGMPIPRYDHIVTYDGLPTRKKLEILSLEKGFPRELHNFIHALKQQYTRDFIQMYCKPTFKHEYALSKLKNENYILGVCSNSIRETVETMLSKAHITKYFDVLLSNEDVNACKPDPEIYLTAMERLKVMPENTLILEDNENGIKSALASEAHLMKIQTIHDVNYYAIKDKIKAIEEGKDD